MALSKMTYTETSHIEKYFNVPTTRNEALHRLLNIGNNNLGAHKKALGNTLVSEVEFYIIYEQIKPEDIPAHMPQQIYCNKP